MIRKEVTMDKRQILILLTIGNLNVSQKCIESVSVDRNFSDVGNKFSITLIDSPATNILYDLELYMASGDRDIILKYGDISKNQLIAFKGTIWDYTNTFVGNIKKLTVTGITSKYTDNTTGVSNWTYNIDWNSYFNKRNDEKKNYGAIDALLARNELAEKYAQAKSEATLLGEEALATLFASSDILDNKFKTAITDNAATLTLKGPSGNTIELPIPDSFISLESSEVPDDVGDTEYDKTTYAKFDKIINDTDKNFWGKLTTPTQTTKTQHTVDYPTLFGVDMTIYIPEDNYKKLNRHADGTIIVDNKFLRGLKGFTYKTMPSGMRAHGLSKEFYEPGLANLKLFSGIFQFGRQWYKDVPLYGEFNKDVNGGHRKEKMTDDITAVIVENQYKDIVAVYYQWKDPTGGTQTFGPYVSVPEAYTGTFLDTWRQGLIDLGYSTYGAIIPETDTELGNDTSGSYYWKDKNDKIRAFMFTDNATETRKFFVQANPEATNSVYGTAGIVNSGVGVDISDIVRKLAVLEGWKIRRETDIVQTELVPNSDCFVMKNQAALEFIINNLVPRAVTPVGEYTDTSGNKVQVSTPQAGFYPFFDDEGYFHFQPLTKESVKKLDIPNLGYNIPNSPVISFQINTKGTAFYTYNNVEASPLSIVTNGQASQEIPVQSEAAIEKYATARHNDTFDAWLGLTYKDVESVVPEGSKGKTYFENAKAIAQNALVTSPYSLIHGSKTELIMSGSNDPKEVQSKLLTAREKIAKFTIKATMSLWGDYRIAPACNIEVINMLKGGVGNNSTPQKHPSSGDYLILSMQDKIDSGGFIQNLNLLRYGEDTQKTFNTYNIDYTQAAGYSLKYVTPANKRLNADGSVTTISKKRIG